MSELLEAAIAGVAWAGVFLLWAAAFARGGAAPHGTERGMFRRRVGPELLAAYPPFFALQVLLARALGAADLLTSAALRTAYVIALVLGVLLYLRRRPSSPAGAGEPAALEAREDVDADDRLIRRVVLGSAGLVLAGLALFTLLSPVHVWDVLAYHMPMVASYVQNGSLDAWPTQDLRQVYRVHAGELQMLNLALLARSDAWVELPNLLALAVVLVVTFELARLATARRALAFLAVALVLTAPQIVVGAATAKNDLPFTAALLCAFYWMIRAGSSDGSSAGSAGSASSGRSGRGGPTGAAGHAALAGLAGALTAATKVMGFNVLAAVGLLAVVLAARGRIAFRHVMVFGTVAVAAVLLLAGDVFLANVRGSTIPVGAAPGEVTLTFGPANLLAAARFYAYELGFKRLVIPQLFEHDMLHYGYFYPLLLVLGVAAAARQGRERRHVLGSLVLAGSVLFLSVVLIRMPIRWDQRFMIWLVPVLAILATSLGERLHGRYLVALTAAAASFGLVNVIQTLTNEGDHLFNRSALHLVASGTMPRTADVPNRRYLSMIDGYAALDRAATAGDSILYVGTDDSWMYPAWGPRFERHVEGVRDADHAAEQVASRRFHFLVVEDEATPEVRREVDRMVTSSNYGVLVRAEGRIVFARAAAPTRRSGGPTTDPGGD